jgi:hypothetical protein
MDLATTDANGFLITRDSEGLEHSAIPWDDPYPFFKGMIPKHEKESVRMSPVSDERSGEYSTLLSFLLTLPVLKIIKLYLETSLKSHASDWLQWQLVAISANQM